MPVRRSEKSMPREQPDVSRFHRSFAGARSILRMIYTGAPLSCVGAASGVRTIAMSGVIVLLPDIISASGAVRPTILVSISSPAGYMAIFPGRKWLIQRYISAMSPKPSPVAAARSSSSMPPQPLLASTSVTNEKAKGECMPKPFARQRRRGHVMVRRRDIIPSPFCFRQCCMR